MWADVEVADDTADVVVVGAGFAGAVAAVAAQEDGATVILLEKGAEPGGSFALSGGYLWTFGSTEAYKRLVPHGDAALGGLVVTEFADGLDWLTSHGVRLGLPCDGLGPDQEGNGRRVEPDPVSGALTPLLKAFSAAGGQVRCRSRVAGMVTDSAGRVTGVRVQPQPGSSYVITCSAVVLATGGFQGDAEMMARHVSPWSDHALLRASPLCTGDGLRLALAAGAAVSSAMNAVYAHVMPAPPAQVEPAAFRSLTQFYVERCVLLNMRGERFVDESFGDAACGLALLSQPGARGFIIFDAARHRSAVREPFVPDAVTRDPVEAVRDAHGEVIEAASLAELGALLQERGVPSGTLRATITAFDTAAQRRDCGTLPVRRTRDLHRCSESPFFAVPVQPGVTFTEGGIKVNTECQALDRDGRPVPGLYVAGVDVGAISNVGYAGALSAALITGLRAGLHGSRWHDAEARSRHRSS